MIIFFYLILLKFAFCFIRTASQECLRMASRECLSNEQNTTPTSSPPNDQSANHAQAMESDDTWVNDNSSSRPVSRLAKVQLQDKLSTQRQNASDLPAIGNVIPPISPQTVRHVRTITPVEVVPVRERADSMYEAS